MTLWDVVWCAFGGDMLSAFNISVSLTYCCHWYQGSICTSVAWFVLYVLVSMGFCLHNLQDFIISADNSSYVTAVKYLEVSFKLLYFHWHVCASSAVKIVIFISSISIVTWYWLLLICMLWLAWWMWIIGTSLFGLSCSYWQFAAIMYSGVVRIWGSHVQQYGLHQSSPVGSVSLS